MISLSLKLFQSRLVGSSQFMFSERDNAGQDNKGKRIQ
jgi:hypothetical protein